MTSNLDTNSTLDIRNLPVGTEIYYGGDMANSEHFGTVVEVKEASAYCDRQYRIQPEADSDREPYWINAYSFSKVYLGHGGTRFVTREAYNAWRLERYGAHAI